MSISWILILQIAIYIIQIWFQILFHFLIQIKNYLSYTFSERTLSIKTKSMDYIEIIKHSWFNRKLRNATLVMTLRIVFPSLIGNLLRSHSKLISSRLDFAFSVIENVLYLVDLVFGVCKVENSFVISLMFYIYRTISIK